MALQAASPPLQAEITPSGFGRTDAAEQPTDWGFNQFLGPTFSVPLGPPKPVYRPNQSSCGEASCSAQASAPGNGGAIGACMSVQSPALNDSFAGSNVVNSGTGPSKEASHSSHNRGGEGGRAKSQSRKGAQNNIEMGWSGQGQGGQEPMQSFPANASNWVEPGLCHSSGPVGMPIGHQVDSGSGESCMREPNRKLFL